MREIGSLFMVPNVRHQPRPLAGVGCMPVLEGRASRASAPPTGLLDERLGSSARTPRYQLYLVAKGNLAAFDNETVERKLAVEPLVDASRNLLVLNLGVGIV
jgi:hypothetical protein